MLGSQRAKLCTEFDSTNNIDETISTLDRCLKLYSETPGIDGESTRHWNNYELCWRLNGNIRSIKRRYIVTGRRSRWFGTPPFEGITVSFKAISLGHLRVRCWFTDNAIKRMQRRSESCHTTQNPFVFSISVIRRSIGTHGEILQSVIVLGSDGSVTGKILI